MADQVPTDETVISDTPRTLLVQRSGDKEFQLDIPENTIVTFGPWSPGTSSPKGYGASDAALSGTIRVYRGSKSRGDVIAVFSGVKSYRDISVVSYREKVAVEEGATVWKSDRNGYERTERVHRKEDWTDTQLLTAGAETDDEDDSEF